MATIGIVGLGLIGGSLGLAFCHSSNQHLVLGWDLRPEVRENALAIGAVHQVCGLKEIGDRADFVFICTPLRAIEDVINQLCSCLRPGMIISDVGSTKRMVMEWLARLPREVVGIGGHPMAGSEKGGIKEADRYLFENAVYVLTPDENTDKEAIRKLAGLIEETGAHVLVMDALLHDQAVAAASHLPHLAACALMAALEGDEYGLSLAASGFRDTTRVASGDPELWADILYSNRDLVAEKLQSLVSQLNFLIKLMLTGDRREIKSFLQRTKQLRDALPQKRSLGDGYGELVCIVPDRPGVIGSLGTWLGAEGINIADLEILRVREGDGGTMRIVLSKHEDGPRAVEILKNRGVKAWLRG